jgi:hypothetical protein
VAQTSSTGGRILPPTERHIKVVGGQTAKEGYVHQEEQQNKELKKKRWGKGDHSLV